MFVFIAKSSGIALLNCKAAADLGIFAGLHDIAIIVIKSNVRYVGVFGLFALHQRLEVCDCFLIAFNECYYFLIIPAHLLRA